MKRKKRLEEEREAEWIRGEVRKAKAAGLSIQQMDPDALRALKVRLLRIYWRGKREEKMVTRLRWFTFGFLLALYTAAMILMQK
ncbi:hypothetical protein [Dialister sp.]|uniref:hypothetical protein n=1 Tax=Dialister sp. TaxID=1955814 RepID=UPI002E81006D|nr:hypothetical protein [Dialister sp.]MEE3453674.1 hypothetical protein [Dialister sp.]